MTALLASLPAATSATNFTAAAAMAEASAAASQASKLHGASEVLPAMLCAASGELLGMADLGSGPFRATDCGIAGDGERAAQKRKVGKSKRQLAPEPPQASSERDTEVAALTLDAWQSSAAMYSGVLAAVVTERRGHPNPSRRTPVRPGSPQCDRA
ncbi:hypothetical protein V8C86DRAFT_3119479 [Haematococcus lacustris]